TKEIPILSSYLGKALEIDKSLSRTIADEYLTKAEELKIKSSEPNDPIWCYTQAVEVESSYKGKVAEICFVTTKDYLEKGFEEASFEYAKKSVDLSPDYIKPGGELYLNKGKVFFDSGDKAKAGKFLRIALSLDPKNETAKSLMKGIRDFSSPTATWNTLKMALRERDEDLFLECFYEDEEKEITKHSIEIAFGDKEFHNAILNSVIIREIAEGDNLRLLQIKVEEDEGDIWFVREDDEWKFAAGGPPDDWKFAPGWSPDEKREAITKKRLGALRGAVVIYYGDHEGRYPLTLDTQRHKDPKNAEQLRPFTDYIKGGELPEAMLRRGVPNSESNKVYYGKTPNNQGGWLYDPSTGRVRVNSTYKDTRGIPYSDY
ncbi:TPA: hypothetical protein DCX15_05310, partial [bacterium]|nr:hypothetical protein [bacterium]